MRKRNKVFLILFLIVLINSLIFLYVYLKNNVSVTLVLIGNRFTSNEEIFSKFEKRTDVFYWYLNKDKIEKQIESLSYVKTARIFPSSLKEFNKLNIAIREEEPFYLIKLQDNQIQVVSNEGKMLSYLASKELLDNNRDFFNSLPVVLGVDEGLDSSQTMNSRLVYIAKFINLVKTKISQTIVSMIFLSSGEVKIKFYDIDPLVVLDLSKSDAWVETQLKRFNAIKAKLGGTINQMSQIDLAYSKVGVLKKKRINEPVLANP